MSLVTSLDPTFGEAYFYSAQIYQILKNYSKAEFFYNQIPYNHNLFIDSQKNIAMNKEKIGLNDEATKLLKNLINNNKKNFNLILALADVYRLNSNYKEAIKYYTEIIDTQNNSYREYWRIFYLRGICFEQLKNWKFAEKDFLKWIHSKTKKQ